MFEVCGVRAGCTYLINRGNKNNRGRDDSTESVPRRGGRTRATVADSYATLGLDRRDISSLTEAEVKAAYRAQVKLCHPDLGSREAEEVLRREQLTLALNDAYVAVLQDLQMPLGKKEPVVLDVFDRCVGEFVGFVNPLEVDVEHVYWYKLQEVFRDECDSDPLLFEERMRQEGVRVNGETVVRWVTVEQYEELRRVVRALEGEGDVVRVEAEGWWIADCLRRARKANLM